MILLGALELGSHRLNSPCVDLELVAQFPGVPDLEKNDRAPVTAGSAFAVVVLRLARTITVKATEPAATRPCCNRLRRRAASPRWTYVPRRLRISFLLATV